MIYFCAILINSHNNRIWADTITVIAVIPVFLNNKFYTSTFIIFVCIRQSISIFIPCSRRILINSFVTCRIANLAKRIVSFLATLDICLHCPVIILVQNISFYFMCVLIFCFDRYGYRSGIHGIIIIDPVLLHLNIIRLLVYKRIGIMLIGIFLIVRVSFGCHVMD